MGGKHTVEYRDNPHTLALLREARESLQKTELTLKQALQDATKDKSKYELVLKNVNDQNLAIEVVPKPMLLGPKGVGKSTFLWLRGRLGKGISVDRPVPSAEDGTCYVSQISDLFDTIGIPIEVDRLMRLLALLIFKGSVPSSVILFSTRSIPDIAVLNHLFINPVSVCCIVGTVTHDLLDEKASGYYDAKMEKLLHAKGITTLRADDEFPHDNGLANAIDKIFPGMKLVMPDFNKLTDPLDVAKATICKYVYFLQNNKDIAELAFMNATKIDI